MIDDLALFDLVYAVIGIACLIGLLILTTRPTRPLSRWTMRRIREAEDRRFESVEENRREFESRMP